MFKKYLEALTDAGKAKMSKITGIGDKTRKKNWNQMGRDKPGEDRLKLVVDPTTQQIVNFGWKVPEWFQNDNYLPGENIGYVRGVIYKDLNSGKVVLTVADTSMGNEVIHEQVLETLMDQRKLNAEGGITENYYDDDIDRYLCVIQKGTKMAFELSESYSLDALHNIKEKIMGWISAYRIAGGKYRIIPDFSHIITSDLQDDFDDEAPWDIELLRDNMKEHVIELMNEYPDITIGAIKDDLDAEFGGILKNNATEEINKIVFSIDGI